MRILFLIVQVFWGGDTGSTGRSTPVGAGGAKRIDRITSNPNQPLCGASCSHVLGGECPLRGGIRPLMDYA